jgi:hypothetical protein
MTTRPDLDLVLGSFLGEGPTEAPDEALDAALDRVATLRQRSRQPRRLFGLSTPVRLLAAAAILIALLVASGIYLGSRPPSPEPLPSPRASAAPTDAPAPSARSSPAAVASAIASLNPLPVPTPLPPIPALALRALYAVDAGTTGARQPGMLTVEDQSRLLELSDGVRFALDEQPDLPRALAAYPALAAKVDELAPKLTGDRGDRLRDAVAVLGDVLHATTFVPEGLDAGTYYSERFTPTVLTTVPEGWSRTFEDSEVLALVKDGVTLAFDKRALEATADGVAAALGALDASGLPAPPEAVTLGQYKGFSGRQDSGGTLWLTDALLAHDAKPGDEVRAWVLDLGAKRALTVHVDGPPKAVARLQPEIEAMLASLQVP